MPPPKAFEDSATKPSKADELLPGHRRTQSSQSNSSSSSAGGGRRGGKKHRRSGSSKSGSGSSSSSAGLSADYGEVIFSFTKGQGLKQEAKARAIEPLLTGAFAIGMASQWHISPPSVAPARSCWTRARLIGDWNSIPFKEHDVSDRLTPSRLNQWP